MAHCTSPTGSTAPSTPSLCPPQAQLDACRSRSDALLADTLHAYASLDVESDRSQWRRVGGRSGVSVFRSRHYPPGPTAALPLRCVGTLRARLDDVLAVSATPSSQEMRARMALACPRVGRCALLHGDPPAAPGEVFAAVKWAALRVLGGCVADRDVVYLERAGFVRPTGRRLAFLALQSVPPATCHDLGRGQLQLCYLLEELRGGSLGVFMLGHVQGFGPTRLVTGAFADLALAVARAPDVAYALQLGGLITTAPNPVDDGRAGCQECETTPYRLETLKQCAGCRRPRICRRCRSRERAVTPQLPKPSRSAVFCASCRAHASSRALAPPYRLSDALPADLPTALPALPADELLGSLGVFSLKISRQLRVLDQQDSEARASVLSSLGSEELARALLESVHSGASDDERDDVLASFHAPPQAKSPSPSSDRPRLSRYSTASSSSSCGGADEAMEAHRQSLMARLQAANDQAEMTFRLARNVWMRSRFEWLDDGE